MNEVWWEMGANPTYNKGVNPLMPPLLQQQRCGDEWSGEDK